MTTCEPSNHRPPTPDDVIRLAEDGNAAARAAVDEWRAGRLTWEQAMMQAVLTTEEAWRKLWNILRDPSVVPREVFGAILDRKSGARAPRPPLV